MPGVRLLVEWFVKPVDKRQLKRLLVGDFTLRRLVRSIFSVLLLTYTGVSAYAYFYAERVIFQPRPSSYGDADKIIKLGSEGGVLISAVHLHNPDARYTILYSHGNAEDIGQLLPILGEIRDAGFSVFAYDYRGYGTSSGAPSEENTYRDAEAAYNYLVNDLGVPADHIIALGRSLGGAVAADLAHRRQLGGLVVESSFITAYRVVTHIPLLPFDKFRTISKIRGARCPVLVIHGKRDEVIPFWHGERLYEEASEPKLSYWVEGAGHNNLFEVSGRGYSRALRDLVGLMERGANARP